MTDMKNNIVFYEYVNNKIDNLRVKVSSKEYI